MTGPLTKASPPNLSLRSSPQADGEPKGSDAKAPGADLIATLLDAIAPGRGNSHWLSFKEAGQLLGAAERDAPQDREALKATLADGLAAGEVGGRPLVLGGRALGKVAAFCGVDPQVYLKVAPPAAQAMARSTTGFEQGPPAALTGAERAAPIQALASTVAGGLADIVAAAQATRSGKDLTTLEGVRAFADASLALHLADRGLSVDDAGGELRFDRSQWTGKALNNPRGLEEAIDGAAAFLAQMVEDRGGPVNLNVALTPKGDLNKTEGTDRDTLWVPTNHGVDAQRLREDWDDGAFIKADSWWNPMDHMKAAKLKALWKVAGNPVGTLRTRLRRTFGDVQSDLRTTLRGLLNKAGSVPPDELRTKAADAVRAFVSPDVNGSDGESVRDALLEKVATVDKDVLVTFLGRWNAAAQDAGLVEDVSRVSLSATSDRLKDSQLKIGLVNVDTYDTVSVAPDSALARHGKLAANEVELSGTRVGLVNVQSVDMVSVVPDLARMIFGGASMERAATETGLL